MLIQQARKFTPRFAVSLTAAILLFGCSSTPEETVSTSASTSVPVTSGFVSLAAIAPVQPAERYQHLEENPVKSTAEESVSTLSLDVDTGSYSNVRRFIESGQMPPADAVRVEELVNYFDYDYPQPAADSAHPFVISTEVAPAPWNADHLLLRIGVKAVEKSVAEMPPANLVFLVDVSGSMAYSDKLPLVQSSLKLLVQQLRAQDRVSLIVYAGRTAMELPSTPGDKKREILAAIERLTAEGSTAGEAALRMAYSEARKNFIPGGINRILLATDGDFNVGITDTNQLIDLVKKEREGGITLTTLGFGTGNYNEHMMEQAADVGNGNYAYIDSLSEAKKVLVEELSSTFNTVAKDVKIQVEFNPSQVAEWRLIGYENRVLTEEQFRNDKVDAAEVGAGKSVTALYELTPVGKPTLKSERRYADKPVQAASTLKEIGDVRLRYKQPEGDTAVEFRSAIEGTSNELLQTKAKGSNDFRFAAAVSAYGQQLKGGTYLGSYNYTQIAKLADGARGSDPDGYRKNFVKMAEMTAALSTPAQTKDPDNK